MLDTNLVLLKMIKQFKELKVSSTTSISAMYYKQPRLGCGRREGRRKMEDVKIFLSSWEICIA